MLMGTLDVDSLVKAVYHVQAMCESLPDLVDMLVRALKPLFEASIIPKLTPLVAVDEAFAQKVLMGLYSPPAPPVDVKPLDLTTESYIVHQLETLYWSMLAEAGANEKSLPQNFALLRPLPADLQPDFHIHVGNHSAACHSWVLFGRWPYFRRLVASGLAEATSMDMILPDDCWSIGTLRAFLRYLYTNNAGLFDPSDQTCTELLDSARLFDLVDIDSKPTTGFTPLIEHCSAPSDCNNITTAVASYQRLLLFGSESQKSKLISFVAENMHTIMSDDKQCAEFASLGDKACATILFASFNRDYPSSTRRVGSPINPIPWVPEPSQSSPSAASSSSSHPSSSGSRSSRRKSDAKRKS